MQIYITWEAGTAALYLPQREPQPPTEIPPRFFFSQPLDRWQISHAPPPPIQILARSAAEACFAVPLLI
jgi:hypothetical protein